MLRMCRFSVLPGMPARTQQMPRTIMSMRAPAQLASSSLRMMSRSLMELFFRIMAAGRPRRAASITRSISSSRTLLKRRGATSIWSVSSVSFWTARFWNTPAASSPMSGSEVMKDRSVYSSLVFSL